MERQDSREFYETESIRFNYPLTTNVRKDSVNGQVAGMQKNWEGKKKGTPF